MKNIISASSAVLAAVSYALLADCSPRCLGLSHHDGMYNLILRTDYQSYEFYVDDRTSEVVGISVIPGLDLDSYPSNSDDGCIVLPEAEPLCA